MESNSEKKIKEMFDKTVKLTLEQGIEIKTLSKLLRKNGDHFVRLLNIIKDLQLRIETLENIQIQKSFF